MKTFIKSGSGGVNPSADRRSEKEQIWALAGNQNCGKTTLFNALTGAGQHVGNFPGVTVEKKEGKIRGVTGAIAVDLPGIYSLSPYSTEERVTRDFLLNERPNCIINVVDATNLERGLFLTMQLLEIGLPVVIALNMMDEVKANGFVIDMAGLEKALGVRVFPISAGRGEGISELIAGARTAQPGRADFYGETGPALKNALRKIAALVTLEARDAGWTPTYAAAQLFEGVDDSLTIDKTRRAQIEKEVSSCERTMNLDREAIVANARYTLIERTCRVCYRRGAQTREQRRAVRLDQILTGKYTGLPIFFGVMFLVFWLTFGAVGQPLAHLLEQGVATAIEAANRGLSAMGVTSWLRSLVVDGVLTGVGSVLAFLPIILTLFFLMSLLEDSGYMARVAFVMDRLMRWLGLSGQAFVPMLLGFGCSVPAVMATRTLPGERDRKLTILLIPFMSCSAKLPVYAMMTAIFFPRHAALVMISLYVLGIVCGILYGLFFKSTVFRDDPMPFVMELPAYRLPSARSVWAQMLRRMGEFVKKACTVILLASIAIWFLKSFDLGLRPTALPDNSILAAIGRIVAPIFRPLGFGDWRLATSVITGLTAKEMIISTLNVLAGGELGALLAPLSAYSMLVFILLYMPCVAAMAAIKRELGSFWGSLIAMASQTGFAWLVSFAVYQVGSFFFG